MVGVEKLALDRSDGNSEPDDKTLGMPSCVESSKVLAVEFEFESRDADALADWYEYQKYARAPTILAQNRAPWLARAYPPAAAAA